MTIASILLLIGTLILFILKPGPNIIANIARSISDGFPAGMAMSAGVTVGQVIFFTLALSGYSVIEAHMSFISFLLKSAGAAYLIYIGIKGLANLESGVWNGRPTIENNLTIYDHFMAALLICFANPFTILFYAAIIPQIIPIAALSITDIIIAYLTIITTYLICHGGISWLASSAKMLLKNAKLVRGINLGTSIIFILIGLFFALTLIPVFTATSL